MHLLALPEDEQEIIRHLYEEEGLQLLLSDLLQEGSPQVAADPLRALVPDLPSMKRLLAAASPTVAVFCVVAGSGRVERWLGGVVARPTRRA
jgi:hypothetical protein